MMTRFFAALVISMALLAPAWSFAADEAAAPAKAPPSPAGGAKAEPAPAAAPAKPAEQPAAEAAAPQAAETEVSFRVPLFSPLFASFPVATVDDEKITLDELNDALAAVHEGAPEEKPEKQVAKIDYQSVLDRLINVRLVVLEAREMGLDEQPEIKAAIAENDDSTLRELLKRREVKGIKPDKEESDKLYKEAVREWKVKSVIFDKEDDAKKMAAALKAGKGFDELADQAVKDKKAQGGGEAQYLRAEKLLPQVFEAVRKMKPGEVSPVVKVETGFVLIKVEGIRYPEDAAARAQADEQSIKRKQDEALKKYFEGLKKKYAKVDKKILKGLDFEASAPGFENLAKDKRVLVSIKGEKPITVADLTDAISEKFFHGVKHGIEEKRVNEQKEPVLQEMLYKMLFKKEALRLGIENTEEYKKMVDDYRTSLIFGAFVQKVIVPDIKVTEEESREYYKSHIADFTYPEMIKLYSIGFGKLSDAEAALKKLQAGTDFKWLKANAEGQLKEDTAFALNFEGEVLSIGGLDEGLKKALSGVHAGDYRLYSASEGQYYVLYVKDETPSKEQPYKEARETTAKKVFNEKLNKSLLDWAGKLRKGHKIKVYITGVGKKT